MYDESTVEDSLKACKDISAISKGITTDELFPAWIYLLKKSLESINGKTLLENWKETIRVLLQWKYQ